MPAFFRHPALLLTIVALFWGGNAVAGKFAVGHISPMVLTFSRWAIALVVMAVIGQKYIRADWDVIKKNAVYLLLMGMFGYAAFNFLLYTALKYTSAINVTIEQTSMPLFIFAINYLLYRINVTWLQIVGYAITVIGVIVTATYGAPWDLFSSGGSGLNRGDLFMLGAALLYASYSAMLSKKPDMHWQSFLFALILGGFLGSALGLVWETAVGQAQWPTTTQGILVALYAGIFPSLVAQGFFVVGVTALGANRAGLFINLVPVFAAILAVMLLGERLHTFHAVAFVLVVGGVLIAQRGTAAKA